MKSKFRKKTKLGRRLKPIGSQKSHRKAQTAYVSDQLRSNRKRKGVDNSMIEPKKNCAKRVSFGEVLEVPQLESYGDEPLKPLKSILRKIVAPEISGRDVSACSDSEQAVAEVNGDPIDVIDSTLQQNNSIIGCKRAIRVKKGVKEKLLLMNRQERKAFIKELQRKRKPNFDLASKCKALWETIRGKKCKESEREKTVNELFSLIKGKAKELIYAHDTSRIIEYLITLQRICIRDALFEELIPEIIRMMKSKYARFFVVKILKNGSKIQRNVIMDSIRGRCVSLMRTITSASVLELIYDNYANARQRQDIENEFYGKEFLIQKEISGAWPKREDFVDQKDKLKIVLGELYETLIDICSKQQLKFSLTHFLLRSFFDFCDNEKRAEMIDLLKDHIPEIVHTRCGADVALQCIWNGTAKERKMIVKNFKGLAVNACKDKYGHNVLFGIFDSVDDTVLVNKYIIQEIVNNINEVVFDRYGSDVIHYLVHPRDPRYFTKTQIELLQKGDGNVNSKKSPEIRYSELFDCVSEPLCVFMASNMDALILNKRCATLVLYTLEFENDLYLFKRTVGNENRLQCYNAMAALCGKEFIPCDTDQFHPVEHPLSHFVISKLLKDDAKCEVKLSKSLADLGMDSCATWISCNKGCFILLHMLENGPSDVQELLKSALSMAALKRFSTNGAKVLLSKLC